MRILSLIFSCLLPLCLLGQVELEGIINTYTIVVDIDYCDNSIIVTNSDGFEVDDQVLLIQMSGATINSSNNAAYGDIENLGSTGRYEKARIAAINGPLITLESALVFTYDLNARVQLVSFPQLENATVTSDISPLPWDGQLGGVLALEVNNTLTLNANIDASNTGFAGGTPDIIPANDCNAFTVANDFFYPFNNWRGARKGNGVAPIMVGMESGRGPQANGGGGANDHNSGGGGGANVTAGGNGGENDEPGFFGCDGRFPGLGGKALPTEPTRLFMGGGGGAGHENNDVSVDGGRGGGIIIIIANTLVSNNASIRSNGASPSTISGDGGSGAGAGGTIVLSTANGSGTLSVEATGGMGGTVNNSSTQRCFGPGGGGSGGRIISAVSPGITTTFSVNGGAPGMTINSSSNSCPDSNNNATAGEDGIQEAFDSIPEGNVANSAPEIINIPMVEIGCPGQMLEIEAEVIGSPLTFQWQVNSSGTFTDLPELTPYSGTQSNTLIIDPVSMDLQDNDYRLVVSSPCFETIASDAITLNLSENPIANFNFDINPDLSVSFMNNSTNATSYIWDFGDTNSSMEITPTHSYENPGNYTVTLSAINECDTATFSVNLEIEGAPSADFTFTPNTGCAPTPVVFTSAATGANNYNWTFEGGTPAFSMMENPVITYNTAGTYMVKLVVSNASGSDSLVLMNAITIDDVPDPSFEPFSNGLELFLMNTSSNADSYSWEFGDTATSEDFEPTHTYEQAGPYSVTLNATNECGSNSITETVLIGDIPNALFSASSTTACLPFPIQFTNESQGNYESIVWFFPGGTPATSMEDNPVVTYDAVGQYDVSLTITGVLGNSMATELDYITIVSVPEPAFSFELVDESTVQFSNASTDADSYFWNFGDGGTSTEENPMHSYSASGVYTVILNASNSSCAKAITMDVQIMLTSTESLDTENTFRLFPNPSDGMVYITFDDLIIGDQFPLKVSNIQGQILYQNRLNNGGAIDLQFLPAGIYFVEVQMEEKRWLQKLVISK